MKKISFLKIIFTLLSVFSLSSCEQEYLNPSTVSETQAIEEVNAIIALCNGLQFRYTNGGASPTYTIITASAITTRELDVLVQTQAPEQALKDGANNVMSNNAITTRLWEELNLVKANAQLILNNTFKIGDPSVRAAVSAHASIYKALALANLVTFFERAPIVVGEQAVFNSRTEVLNEAINLCRSAADGLAGVTIPASFTSKTTGNINYINTANALAARYYNMLGDNANAIVFANKVPTTFRSQLIFDAVTRNPLFDASYSNRNRCEPYNTALGLTGALAPTAGDGRIAFHLKVPQPTGTNLGKGFFETALSAIPFYVPGEMQLIKAEAYARLNDFPNATTALNAVLTKTAASDVYGLGANLPAYSGAATQPALLLEIYKNRRIELFMSGLTLEDSRRFGRPGPGMMGAERTRNFFPYPLSEITNNPNTPPNPAN